jgi:hypothetical protein
MEANLNEKVLFSEKGKALVGYLPIVKFDDGVVQKQDESYLRSYIYHRCLLKLLYPLKALKGKVLNTADGVKFFYIALSGMLGMFFL